ncbi:MAG TPA: hypothetical protein VHF25_07380, partial [Nitriliruptorales bacterium]|nr:hypothetical protein [Nitriliruptorales bacterium]
MCILALAAGEGLDVALSLAVAGEEVTVVGSVDAAAGLVGSFPVAVIDLGDTAGGVAAARSLLSRRRVERCVVVGDTPQEQIPVGVSLLVRPLDMPELLTRVYRATGRGRTRDAGVAAPSPPARPGPPAEPAAPPQPAPTQASPRARRAAGPTQADAPPRPAPAEPAAPSPRA